MVVVAMPDDASSTLDDVNRFVHDLSQQFKFLEKIEVFFYRKLDSWHAGAVCCCVATGLLCLQQLLVPIASSGRSKALMATGYSLVIAGNALLRCNFFSVMMSLLLANWVMRAILLGRQPQVAKAWLLTMERFRVIRLIGAFSIGFWATMLTTGLPVTTRLARLGLIVVSRVLLVWLSHRRAGEPGGLRGVGSRVAPGMLFFVCGAALAWREEAATEQLYQLAARYRSSELLDTFLGVPASTMMSTRGPLASTALAAVLLLFIVPMLLSDQHPYRSWYHRVAFGSRTAQSSRQQQKTDSDRPA